MNSLSFSSFHVMAPSNARRALGAARSAGLALLLCGAVFGALAQYKIVSPDGHVTYTDTPPAGRDARSSAGSSTGSGSNSSGGGLPYETRQASARYPVALYAARNCPGCDQARQWLRSHGVPFSEYSVNSNDDVTLLQQRFGDTTVPVVTFGSQTVKSFSTADLQSYADAAGYPRQASLGGYSWPAPVPLAPPARAGTAQTAPATPAAPSVTLPPPSPSGIQF